MQGSVIEQNFDSQHLKENKVETAAEPTTDGPEIGVAP
jgi:hypothetical protein